jgi:peptide/nickel transport system substrate-binding protein
LKAAAFEVRRLWEGTGNHIRFDVLGGLHQLEIQHRPEYARPSNGLTNRPVRHALYHAIDRQMLTDVMTQGLAPYADSYYAPNDAFRRDVEAHIPQYPFDPARASRLLEAEGWTRGQDGVLVHRQSGERYQTAIQQRPGEAQLRAGQIIGDAWKAVGVHTEFEVLTGVVLNDGQHLSLRPGPALISPSGSNFYDRRLHSGALPSPQNRWSGNNRGGFSSPRVDSILDRLAVTVDASERIALHRDLLQEQMGELALMPLYWQVEPILMVAGVSGPKMQGNVATPNIYEWDKR